MKNFLRGPSSALALLILLAASAVVADDEVATGEAPVQSLPPTVVLDETVSETTNPVPRPAVRPAPASTAAANEVSTPDLSDPEGTSDSFSGVPIEWEKIPRSVTTLDSERFGYGTVDSVRDWAKFYAGGFSKTNFGSPAHPSVRGLPTDVFVDGMRQGLRSFGNGMPFSTNAYESLDLVKGMPPPAFGLQQYVSGYVNLHRKLPKFEGPRGSAGFTVGSFDTKSYRFQFEDQLTDSLAYLFSAELENSGSYYENGFRDTEAFYLAIAYEPENSAYSANLSFDYYSADYTENYGINRPTQRLIDDGLYQTGLVIDQNGDGVRDNRDIVGGFNTIALGPLRPIDRRIRLLGAGDQGNGEHLNIHFQQKWDDGGDVKWINDTTIRWVDRQLLSSYFYSEVIDDSYAIENRLMRVQELPSLFLDDEEAVLTTGIGLRYQQVDAVNDYFNEPTNAWDLLSNVPIRYVNQVAGGAVPIPGRPGFFGFPGQFNGESNDSEAYTFSPFVQWRTAVTERLDFDTGFRYDLLHVDYSDPLSPFTDSYTAHLPLATMSLIYELCEDWSVYGTVNYGHSTGIANGGGYGVTPAGFTYDYFHRENFLAEVGLKGVFDDGGRFSLAVFSQERTEGLLGTFSDRYLTRGVEVEYEKPLGDTTTLWLNYAYLDSILDDQAPFVLSGAPVDGFGPDGTPGFVTPTFTNLPRGDYREPGLPMHTFNIGLEHRVTERFSILPSLNVTSEMNNNYSGTLVIPSQHWMDLTFRYRDEGKTIWLSLVNVTDQENWSPPNPIFGNDSILAEMPFHIRGGMTVEF